MEVLDRITNTNYPQVFYERLTCVLIHSKCQTVSSTLDPRVLVSLSTFQCLPNSLPFKKFFSSPSTNVDTLLWSSPSVSSAIDSKGPLDMSYTSTSQSSPVLRTFLVTFVSVSWPFCTTFSYTVSIKWINLGSQTLGINSVLPTT